MYTLRYYQNNASDSGIAYFKDPHQKKPVLMIISTGAGKSLIIADIAQKLNEPLCVFSPTKEILEQNYQKMLDFGIMGVTIYSASCNQKNIGNITLATIGSVYRKPNDFKVFKHFIVDECDTINPKGGMYKTFIDAVGGKYIGLTATPYRMSSDGYGGTIMKFLTRTNPRVFSKVIHVTQTKELLDQGYLAKTEYFQINGFTRSEIKLNSTGADYLESSEREYYDKTEFSKRIIKVVNRLLEIGKTRILVFTKFVEEARELSKQLGECAAIVNCEMKPKERDSIIKGFKSGDIKVVLNVGILTIGFDYPELEVVVMARPTRSLRLYYQTIGRCLRPHPSKEKAMVIDLCGNFSIFGKVEDMRVVERGGENLWCVMSQNRQLTNIYLDQIMKD
jgi:DNA repair protein RadD